MTPSRDGGRRGNSASQGQAPSCQGAEARFPTIPCCMVAGSAVLLALGQCSTNVHLCDGERCATVFT
jgi:hypothetical protein